MSTNMPKNPYHDIVSNDELIDAREIENPDVILPYIVCCDNPEYGTVGFAKSYTQLLWTG